MPRCFEFEGQNIEKAVEKACEELKLPKEKIKYDILSYGSSGIFGLVGVKKARIKVILPDEISNNLNNLNVENGNKINNNYENLDEDKIENANKNYNNENEDNDNDNDDDDDEDYELNQDNIDEKDEKAYENLKEAFQLGEDILNKILNLITDSTEVSINKYKSKIIFNIKGGNSGVLIGKHGQNLDAIQFILSKVVNKKAKQKVRVEVDIEGYLNSRKVKLKALASKMASRVVSSGKPSTISQLSAQDRKIVHLALKTDSKVRTQSIGDGSNRKLIIFPKTRK